MGGRSSANAESERTENVKTMAARKTRRAARRIGRAVLIGFRRIESFTGSRVSLHPAHPNIDVNMMHLMIRAVLPGIKCSRPGVDCPIVRKRRALL